MLRFLLFLFGEANQLCDFRGYGFVLCVAVHHKRAVALVNHAALVVQLVELLLRVFHDKRAVCITLNSAVALLKRRVYIPKFRFPARNAPFRR